MFCLYLNKDVSKFYINRNQTIFIGNKIKNSNLHIMRQYVSGNLASIKILIENYEIIT